MATMHLDVFGEIAFDEYDLEWTGSCSLPVFAEYGKLGPDDSSLSEPAPEFRLGRFTLSIQDDSGDGPSPQQANVFRFLLEHEPEVCVAVMTEVVNACDMRGGPIRWLQDRRESRLWGWLARLTGPEYKTPDDLKQAARCTGLEVSSEYVGAHAYLAFYFETMFGIEVEHGLSVIFHPEKETFWGDASAIHEML